MVANVFQMLLKVQLENMKQGRISWTDKMQEEYLNV